MFSAIIVDYMRWRVLSAANTGLPGGRFFSDSRTNPPITSQISEFWISLKININIKLCNHERLHFHFKSRWRNESETSNPGKTNLSPNCGYVPNTCWTSPILLETTRGCATTLMSHSSYCRETGIYTRAWVLFFLQFSESMWGIFAKSLSQSPSSKDSLFQDHPRYLLMLSRDANFIVFSPSKATSLNFCVETRFVDSHFTANAYPRIAIGSPIVTKVRLNPWSWFMILDHQN